MQAFPDFDALARLFDRRSLGFEILGALGCTLLRRLLHFVTVLFGASGRRGYEFVRLSWRCHLAVKRAGGTRGKKEMRRRITSGGHYTARPVGLLSFLLTWPPGLRA